MKTSLRRKILFCSGPYENAGT